MYSEIIPADKSGSHAIKTMSSLEISELTGKRHDNIIRDIKRMVAALKKAKVATSNLGWHCESVSYEDKQGKKRLAYRLDKETSITLLAGYDVVARHKIITRWSQLEQERQEEEQNPELAIQRGHDRATKTWKKQGKSDKWIESRIKGIATRRFFTKILSQHGVKKEGYRNCTNAVYGGLYGGSAAVARLKKNLPDGANIRENASLAELHAISLIEILASEKIESTNAQGNGACELICSHVSQSIGQAIVQARKQR